MTQVHTKSYPGMNHGCNLSSTPLSIPHIQFPFLAPPACSDSERLRTRGLTRAQRYGLFACRMFLQAFPDVRWATGFQPTEHGFLNRCPERPEVTS